MKKILISILLISFSTSIMAGFNGFTNHSRANCANNESISWDWTHDWVLWTRSEHWDARTNALIHYVATGWETTWRSAAVHWGEGKGGWKVIGTHWRMYTDNSARVEAYEVVTDCSIYDGWWDRNK